jgi:hypothetical protein
MFSLTLRHILCFPRSLSTICRTAEAEWPRHIAPRGCWSEKFTGWQLEPGKARHLRFGDVGGEGRR